MFDCFGVRFVLPVWKKSQTFKMAKKSRKNGTNMDIILSFLAKSVDKRGITLVHITYPPLSFLRQFRPTGGVFNFCTLNMKVCPSGFVIRFFDVRLSSTTQHLMLFT